MFYDFVISDGVIVSMEPGSKPFIGSLGIKDGKIEDVVRGRLFPQDGENYISAKDKIIFPGLVNGHCHGDMTILRGIADDMTLLEQNEKFAPLNFLSDHLNKQDRYYSRQLTYIEAIKSGTTFITENMYWSLGLESVNAMVDTGIKGALAEDIRKDFTNPEQLISEENIKKFAENCKKNNIIPIIGSISEEDFDEKLLEKIFAIAQKNNLFTTQHLAETTWRLNLSKKYLGDSPIRALDNLGLLSENFIGSHGIYIDDDEIKSMHKTSTKIVNTPVCEMKISDGIAPIPEFLREGIITGLGTDGALWNNCNDMFREIKGLILLHSISKGVRQINAKQALEMATINGATVFGEENKFGTLSPGKCADFIIVDASEAHMKPLRVGEFENIHSLLAYNTTGRDVDSVFINGSPVMLNRKLLSIDEDEVINEVQAASDKIQEKLPKDAFTI